MFNEQKVLDAMKLQGPVIPIKIAKVLGTDTIMASAVLSNLLSSKKIKISKLKVGGTPVYYLPGQESKLQDFENHLNEKDKNTVVLLRHKKIIRDKEAEPLTRVSLRQVKDFAVPLQVNINGNRELFWKWYLLSNQEAEQILKLMLEPPKKEAKQEIKPEAKQEPPKQYVAPTLVYKTPKPMNEIKPTQPKQEIKPEVQQEIPKNLIETKKEEKPEPVVKRIVQKVLKPRAKEKPKDDFFKKVNSHFSRKEISIIKEISKKKTEADYIVKIPSPVGELEYFCRVKDKKKISDTDLDAVFAHGQLLKLPIILMIHGELSKKAQEKLKDYKLIKIKKL